MFCENRNNYCSILCETTSNPGQIKGTTIENFIAEAQSRSKNALNNSLQAALGAWEEQLRSDQVVFDSEKILQLG